MVAGLDEVMVEGSVGAPGRTDCDHREVQFRDGVGGDGGGYGGLLPVSIGVVDQIGCNQETCAHNKEPQKLTTLTLIKTSKVSLGYVLIFLLKILQLSPNTVIRNVLFN